MGWREDFHNFNLGRLTLLGWLVFLFAIAAGIGTAIVADSLWESAQPGERSRGRSKLIGVISLLIGIALFFGALALLRLAGFTVVRPKRAPTPEDQVQEESKEERS
jgi:hypothetical protein